MQEDSVKNHINLIKLSVGTETVDDLAAWQEKKQARTSDGFPRHVTRMWPKREPEILNGGAIFWVWKRLRARTAYGVARLYLIPRLSAFRAVSNDHFKAGDTLPLKMRPPTCQRAANMKSPCPQN